MKFPFVLRKKHDEKISSMEYRIEAAERAADDAKDTERRYYDARLHAAVCDLHLMEERVKTLAGLQAEAWITERACMGFVDAGVQFSMSKRFIFEIGSIDGAMEYIAEHAAREVKRFLLDSDNTNFKKIIAEFKGEKADG